MIKRLADYSILGLSVLLIFLFTFESYLEVPDWLIFAGRLHPVVLHFPIVLLIISVLNSWTKTKPYQRELLSLTVIFTLITALSGFFLSVESGTKGTNLTWHQWFGGSVSLMAALWYGLETSKQARKWMIRPLKVGIVVLIVLTGHFGGMVTHGADFLSWPDNEEDKIVEIPDDPVIYEHIVRPILNSKCVSCHNPDRSKGGLHLTDYNGLLKGGDSGPAILSGQSVDSEIITRINLPLSHEDHMPPPEKEQLTEDEKLILEEWIHLGASQELNITDIEEDTILRVALMNYLQPSESGYDHLPEVSEALINDLSSDYFTLRRVSEGSQALSVIVYPFNDYEKDRLKPLKPVEKNIVELDISRLPVGEEEFDFLVSCTSLEKLEMNETPVTDRQLQKLKGLDQLKVLKAQGTSLSDGVIATLKEMTQLEHLFIWGTDIGKSAVEELRTFNTRLEVNTGIDPDISFSSTLPAPMIDPDRTFFIDPFKVNFEHPLENIEINYTLDGQDPEETGMRYTGAISIDKTMTVKFLAKKEGWNSSPVDSIRFFKSSKGPDKSKLVYPPDEKYVGRGYVSLFDLEKGPFNLRDSAWLGFQTQIMELRCSWENPVEISNIILSSFINTGIHVFPPAEVQIYGGSKGETKKLLYSRSFSVLEREQGSSFHYITCPVKATSLDELLIKVTPLEALPQWHVEKGKPGWFFIDEVVLEE